MKTLIFSLFLSLNSGRQSLSNVTFKHCITIGSNSLIFRCSVFALCFSGVDVAAKKLISFDPACVDVGSVGFFCKTGI